MQQALHILNKYWGYPAFRPGQEGIITSILSGRDTLALLPTGGGKSLCYQVPAMVLDGFCLVVSPLIALMQDQVQRLSDLGIPAACIHAGMHAADVKRILENMIHGPYKLLYVSPERLQTSLFQEYLPAMDISFIAVDEAHCVSQWGHDFRPDYLKIASLRKIFKTIPILAVTASATEAVQADIALQLNLRQPAIFRQSFERTNIRYHTCYSENKANDMLARLQEQPGSTIIYCRSRKQTESVSKLLQSHGMGVVHYHAGMPKDRRQEAQAAWMNGSAKVMVATTAFGMGIDKGDVRMVLHYDAPEHLEAYYQESGRAGRDGQSASSVLLYNKTDIRRLQESIMLQYPPEAYLRQVYQAVVEYLQVAIGTQPDRYYNFDLGDFCKRFKLEALPASHALRLLEQEGLWTISDAVFNPATVQFTITRQELDNVARAYPELGLLTTTLLRLYGTVFQHPTAINIIVVAKRLKAKKEYIAQLLHRLHRMEVLEYNTPREGPQLFFHHYRVDSRHLIIDLQRIETLRARHRARTEAIIAYLGNTVHCRTSVILQYFGEAGKAYCGHCDVCLEKGKTALPTSEYRKQIQALISNGKNISITQCIAQFPLAIRNDILTLIREMADGNELKLHPDGSLSAV